MTELEFSKVEQGLQSYYECEVMVEDNFNLHIERDEDKPLTLEVSSVENGAYKEYSLNGGLVFDEDFDAWVYPKYLRIRSWSEPTAAYLTQV